MKLERYGYFFGYGADREPVMIKAIIGHKPQFVAKAVLNDFELHIQDISEIKATGANPQKLLRNCWGDDFKSYVIVPKT